LLVDHSARARWVFRGAGARATVAGLVTNDVAGLAAGHGCYAAALTPKGRIVADVRIFAVDAPAGAGAPAGSWLDGAALVVDVPARAAEGWEALVRKFVNPRSAQYRAASADVRAFGVYGLRARDAVAGAFGASPSALGALPAYGQAVVTLAGGETLLVARVPDAGAPAQGLDGFVVFAPADAWDAAWARVAGGAPGVVAGGEGAYAVARVEAGYPEWGVDIDDTTIPQEANLDELGAISYTKGCYTGQEVVARVHFRGHVNRHLRGLLLDDAPDGPPLPARAALHGDEGAAVGDVRSVVRSPRLGPIALGMVRREVAPGAALEARWTDADGRAHARGATVVALPFAARPPAA
jgi:folate-binding protein YgfZ